MHQFLDNNSVIFVMYGSLLDKGSKVINRYGELHAIFSLSGMEVGWACYTHSLCVNFNIPSIIIDHVSMERRIIFHDDDTIL